jgi:hypothetical protein
MKDGRFHKEASDAPAETPENPGNVDRNRAAAHA